ncbi:MAG: ELWxxDGT repeat protein [Chitinophagaceae bacterium]
MKPKYLLLAFVLLMLTVLTANAQDAIEKKHAAKDIIPFGQKLPPPDITRLSGTSLPQMTDPGINAVLKPDKNNRDINTIKKNLRYHRLQLQDKIKEQASNFPANVTPNNAGRSNTSCPGSGFRLTKDINALAESNPRNFASYRLDIYDNLMSDSASYAVLENVIYFIADDGIHGNELWRSDGTAAGTYMVKDIEPGITASYISNITAANGKIYFTAYSTLGNGAWVSDGTESGTQLLISVGEPIGFFAMGKKVYFIASGVSFWTSIWETDGTTDGTKQVIEIGDRGGGGEQITQPTIVNGLLFFTFIDYETFSWQIWRSDLTDGGTYHVGPSYPVLDPTWSFFENFTPAQLTNYKHKLYYSANDGTGRKLWVSDGTDAGTTPAPGNHDILIGADYLGTGFPILNNALCIPGEGNGLYKYDASVAAGLIQIKDFAPAGDTAFIVPSEMQVVNKTLYFKVTNYHGDTHDELWSSKGTKASTQLVYKLRPGETINNLYNGSGIFYFVKYDKTFGTELWRTFETHFGTFPLLVSDIFKGATSSYPAYLTAFKGKLVFTAADEKKGNELFITSGNFFRTALVKDINTVSTTTSDAGFNPYSYLGYSGMVALGKEVLFNASERVHGFELYKSDGTSEGTKLLSDVMPGEAGVRTRIFLSKNNAVYFLAVSNTSSSIYRTDGTKNGLVKITPDYSNIQSFSVADNGLVFYTVYNPNTSGYELFRSNGTAGGTFLLSPAIYFRDYLNIINNTALFVAGDAVHGYELWKSDGSPAGTAIVKDINPGVGNSVPGGMFLYHKEVYFSALDGTGANPSFWKSNGTEAGTIRLKNIDPFWGSTVAATKPYFCVFNNLLYFSAIDHSNADGTVFWKTDGTIAGTQPLKDINPISSAPTAGPIFLTDVNGTLFFTADDGVNGRELWKSDGTATGTQLVQDITPGVGGSNIAGLTSFGGKLFFQNAVNGRYNLWSSDGTAGGTNEVEGLDILNVFAIFPTTDNLFIGGYTYKYGAELYAGKICNQSGKFVMSGTANEKSLITASTFNAMVYPNPALSNSTLQISGDTKKVSISITDVAGKKLWQSNSINAKFVSLPSEKYGAGIYFVTVTNGMESKTIKLVKQ